MKLQIFGDKEKLDHEHEGEMAENGRSNKHQRDAAFEVNVENNLYVKASMVTELVEMGFSLDAIERILNLKPEVLDRLL